MTGILKQTDYLLAAFGSCVAAAVVHMIDIGRQPDTLADLHQGLADQCISVSAVIDEVAHRVPGDADHLFTVDDFRDALKDVANRCPPGLK